ncbi:MAG TPA: hypothetical protein VLD18_09940 [Verrucomicrobiae bacterium]|nr:hypothetical protein [Verrucomicrobiae bacterium]
MNPAINLQPLPSATSRSRLSEALLVATLILAATSAGAYDDLTLLSDEFDDAGSLSNWLRIHETEGWNNDTLETFDANTTRPGQLVMMPHTSSWYEEYRGELTYKLVTGDFVITTFVEPRNRAGTGRPERDYSLAGIMVRSPRSMTSPDQWTPLGQNYVFLSMGSANRATGGYDYEVKTTLDSVSTLVIEGAAATRATIQVARIGPHLLMLRRDEGGEWVVHRRYHRPDFPATLQAGLTVYTDWDTCFAVGVENNNRLVLTNGVTLLGGGTLNNAQPDLVATFDFVRFARPQVPAELTGADLSNPGAVTDQQLLAFLGEHANVPGGAVTAPVFQDDLRVEGNALRVTADVVNQRSYRLQSRPAFGAPWVDAFTFISTNNVQALIQPLPPEPAFFRLISP